MVYLFPLVFLITIATLFADYTTEPIVQQRIDGEILAQQLILQQAAASRTCPLTTTPGCADGSTLDVSAQLASYDVKDGSHNFSRGNGSFVSFVAGTRVVSYYQTTGARERQVYGSMGAWLSANGFKANLRYIGYFHAGLIYPNGTVQYRVMSPDHSYQVAEYNLLPVTIPRSLDEGTPMVATDILTDTLPISTPVP